MFRRVTTTRLEPPVPALSFDESEAIFRLLAYPRLSRTSQPRSPAVRAPAMATSNGCGRPCSATRTQPNILLS